MEKNNNNLPEAEKPTLTNGHALTNGNGVIAAQEPGAPPAAEGWGQALWNIWDAFADVAWFIICCIGYILQVSFYKK